jgi:hypothetical protein
VHSTTRPEISLSDTLKCIVYILVLLNRLFKIFKWIEDRLKKLYK